MTIIPNTIAGTRVKKDIPTAVLVVNGGSRVDNMELSNAKSDNEILSVIFARFDLYGLSKGNITSSILSRLSCCGDCTSVTERELETNRRKY
jgi:hypothetical protein